MPESDRDPLSQHRIREVKTRKLRTRWPRLLGRNARLEEHGYGRELLVREVLTDQGAVGWGLSRRLPPQQTPQVEGRLVSELFDPAIGVIDPVASPLDFALHDLAGALLGQPVYRMLGGRGPTHLASTLAATLASALPCVPPGSCTHASSRHRPVGTRMGFSQRTPF